MPNWINAQKTSFLKQDQLFQGVNINLFSDEQRLAYDIITTHSNKIKPKEPLWLIINGVAGTGKSYLIRALKSYLKQKCVITATTGKAAYSIRGVTIHSLLKLPTGPQSEKDLSSQSLVELQEKLSTVDCILIDEYSGNAWIKNIWMG